MPRGNNPFVAGSYIRELVIGAGEVGISFEGIWKAFLDRGWDKEGKTKVYASVMQEKTKGNIAKGLGKQLFVDPKYAKEEFNGIREGLKPVNELASPNKRTRQVASRQKEITNDNVLLYLTDQLGPSIEKPKDKLPYTFVLIGDKSGEQIIGLYVIRYQKDPTHWYQFTSPMEPFYTHVGLWSE